jgi:hypothetical protein
MVLDGSRYDKIEHMGKEDIKKHPWTGGGE